MTSSRFFWTGWAVTVTALFARRLGIHFDENNYLDHSLHAILGDCLASGKPVLFYVVNYLLVHAVGFLSIPWRLLFPYFVYAALNCYALAVFATRARKIGASPAYLFALLLLSSFFILNSTQLMMETPLLALFAWWLSEFFEETPRGRWRARVLAAVALSVLVKDSAIPALLLGSLAFWWARRPVARWSLLSLLVGILGLVLCRKLLSLPAQHFAGVGTGVFRVSHWWPRLQILPGYAGTWVFFVAPLALGAGLVWRSARRPTTLPGAFALAGILSFVSCLLVVWASNYFYVRYEYPSVWLGMLAFGVLAATVTGRPTRAFVLAVTVLPTLNLWGPDAIRFALWPPPVKNEWFYSRSTILANVPVAYWLLKTGPRFAEACAYVPADTLERERYVQFFGTLLGAKIVDTEASLAACPGPAAVLKRDYHLPLGACECPSSASFSLSQCYRQTMRLPPDDSSALALTCLP